MSLLKITGAVLLAAAVGCSRSDRAETSRVRGVVTLDGALYTRGGAVLFQPAGSAKMATGRIASDGSFELSTYSPGDGAAVGRHQVIVKPPVAASDEQAEGKALQQQSAPFPAKYSAAATSGLVCDVKPGQVNEYPIEMKSE
jgi:hypothetical protein